EITIVVEEVGTKESTPCRYLGDVCFGRGSLDRTRSPTVYKLKVNDLSHSSDRVGSSFDELCSTRPLDSSHEKPRQRPPYRLITNARDLSLVRHDADNVK